MISLGESKYPSSMSKGNIVMKQTMSEIFEVERDGDILIVTPKVDLGESFFEEHRDEATKLLKAIDEAMNGTTYFFSLR